MLGKLKGRLTYANVMSTLALFMALSTGAYAAATIGAGDIKRNAVRSRHIQNGQVKTADLTYGAVTTPKLTDGAITTAKLADAGTTTAKLADGAVTASKVAPGTIPVIASRSVTFYPAGQALTGVYSTMIDLSSVHDGGGDQRISIASPARILANATVDIYSTGTTGPSGICMLSIDGVRFSQETEFDFPTSGTYDISVPLTGGVVRPAGTYDVDVECANTPLSLNSADLVVWAIPA